MSKKTLLAFATVVACALPSAASAQIGIAARAGTLGIGGEAAIGLGRMLQVRGGIGSTKYDLKGTLGDNEYTVSFPDKIWNVGVDVFPFGGGLHLSAGFLNRPEFAIKGSSTKSSTFGNTTYTGTVNAAGTVANKKETNGFVGLGFGRTSKRGLGISLDLGVAFTGDATVDITSASCTGTCPHQPTASEIAAEETKISADINDKQYAKYHPIASLSLHYGIGK